MLFSFCFTEAYIANKGQEGARRPAAGDPEPNGGEDMNNAAGQAQPQTPGEAAASGAGGGADDPIQEIGILERLLLDSGFNLLVYHFTTLSHMVRY